MTQDVTTREKGSLLSGESVTVIAGRDLTVTGSAVAADRDVKLQAGRDVEIGAATETDSHYSFKEKKKSGLMSSGGIGFTVGKQSTRHEIDEKGTTLSQSVSTVGSSQGSVNVTAGNRLHVGGADLVAGQDLNLTGDSVIIDPGVDQRTRRETSEQKQSGLSIALSGTAGSALNTAVSSAQQARKSGDGRVSALQNTQAAQNTQNTESTNSSKGGSVGIGIGVGSGGYGITVSASVNAAKGSEKGNGLTHTETTLDAGSRLSLTSGRDTTLQGAQASGEKVTVNAGRNLTLTSEQDSDRYDSKQQSASAGGSFTFGSMTGSANVNVSRDKMHSTWQSVAEQTGIFAGKGGFDVTVGEHTQLNGAVISSTATADKNQLDTGTLGFGDIESHADYKVEHQSAGMSTGGSIAGQFAGNMANGMLAGLNDSGSADSTTKAAVSEGTIVIRDPSKQKQDVAGLSRDVANANPGLEVIFDKEKEQNRLKAAQLIGEIGSQAGDIARTEGEIKAITAGKAELEKKDVREPEKGASKEAWAEYNEKLTESAGYKTAQQEWGTGSAIQQGIQAATAAIQGLAGGDMAAAISGASAPYIAEVIKQKAPDEASRVMAHAAVAGVIAAAQGNSAAAAAGAAGAATTALMGEAIKNALYGDVPVSQLSEEQKQTLVALGSLAAGLAGGLTGDSTADAVAGAQAGQNEISNNMTSMGMLQMMQAKSLLDSAAMAEAGQGGANEQAALALTKKVKAGLDAACLQNASYVLMAVVTAQNNSGSDGAQAPNIGKGLTDDQKKELGGSGTGTPPPPENDPKQQNGKPAQKLSQKQESAIKKIDNTIKNALKDHDITGTLKDMDGKPVPRENGGYWDHMQEMQNTLRGLRNHADTLKNVDNPEAQAAYGRATEAINKIESALKGHGI